MQRFQMYKDGVALLYYPKWNLQRANHLFYFKISRPTSTAEMHNFSKWARRDMFLLLLQILNMGILLSSITLLMYSVVSIFFRRGLI
jgi:hypothetical protein